jgi:hypothetical protein
MNKITLSASMLKLAALPICIGMMTALASIGKPLLAFITCNCSSVAKLLVEFGGYDE